MKSHKKGVSNSIKTDLRELWLELKNNLSPPHEGNVERINYREFKKIGEKFGAMFTSYFKANTFLKFDKDKYGRIEILAFFHYVVRKTNIEENKITLSLSDSYCEGFLTDKDLETYIKEEIKQFYFYDEISEDIREYYLLVAQRKFFFFLDPKRSGKIYINDIITSNILTEFNDMKEKPQNESQQSTSNWFSLTNFWRIYKKYIDLDKDKNGMLSKEELIRFGPGLTMIFIDRIFEEYQKYENAIDFKQFIDFVLAMENRKAPASIQYIWRAIDVYHKNAVDTFVLNMFYKQVVKKLLNRGKGEYKIDDIKDELWDMVKPKNENYITLQDVLSSTYSDTVLSLLIDAKAFYLHDQKEMQVNLYFKISLLMSLKNSRMSFINYHFHNNFNFLLFIINLTKLTMDFIKLNGACFNCSCFLKSHFSHIFLYLLTRIIFIKIVILSASICINPILWTLNIPFRRLYVNITLQWGQSSLQQSQYQRYRS
jgi:serine/threonine-protein phosphatase 2A regulatory subunit B''